jgi:hypothetical protein
MLSQARSPRKPVFGPVRGLAVAAVIAPCLTVLPASAADAVGDRCPSPTLSSAQLKDLIEGSQAATSEAAREGIVITTHQPASNAAGSAVARSVAYDGIEHRSRITENAYYGGFAVQTVMARTPARRALMTVPSSALEKQAIGLLHRGRTWKDVLATSDPDVLADAASFLAVFGRPLTAVAWWAATDATTCTSTQSETVIHITTRETNAGGSGLPITYTQRFDLRLAPSGAFRSLMQSGEFNGLLSRYWITSAYGTVSVELPPPAQVIAAPRLAAAVDSASTRDRLKGLTAATVTRVKAAAAAGRRAPRAADVHAAARQLVLDTKDTLIRRSDGVELGHRDPLGGPVLFSRIFVTKNGLRTRTNL